MSGMRMHVSKTKERSSATRPDLRSMSTGAARSLRPVPASVTMRSRGSMAHARHMGWPEVFQECSPEDSVARLSISRCMLKHGREACRAHPRRRDRGCGCRPTRHPARHAGHHRADLARRAGARPPTSLGGVRDALLDLDPPWDGALRRRAGLHRPAPRRAGRGRNRWSGQYA